MVPGRDGDGAAARFQSCADVVGVGNFSSQRQTEIDAESYLDKRVGISIDRKHHSFCAAHLVGNKNQRNAFGPGVNFHRKMLFCVKQVKFCLMGSRANALN